MPDPHAQEALALMTAFAERTGLTSDRPRQRYLWTDAFAVCNLLGLARSTGEACYTALALQLIDQVHHTLGRHREDDARSGWISGLTDAEGEAHPTRGGLRIGKALPERGPDEPYDEALEWDRDGQYFHYLAKWMHALDQAARATGRPQLNLWARELAQSAQHAFTYQPAGETAPRMVWKMSIDLQRPLVPSMGQHDPLDGYIACLELRATAAALAGAAEGPDLTAETRRYAEMIEGGEWATADPLGIGGLLSDAYRVEQLMQRCAPTHPSPRRSVVVAATAALQPRPVPCGRKPGSRPYGELLETLLASAFTGLRHYAQSGELQLPAEYRLAFRELGLAIGLHTVERMRQAAEMGQASFSPEAQTLLQALLRHVPVGRAIESFWLDPGHRRASTWAEHRDINEVMLATSLAPEGFLVLFDGT